VHCTLQRRRIHSAAVSTRRQSQSRCTRLRATVRHQHKQRQRPQQPVDTTTDVIVTDTTSSPSVSVPTSDGCEMCLAPRHVKTRLSVFIIWWTQTIKICLFVLIICWIQVTIRNILSNVSANYLSVIVLSCNVSCIFSAPNRGCVHRRNVIIIILRWSWWTCPNKQMITVIFHITKRGPVAFASMVMW